MIDRMLAPQATKIPEAKISAKQANATQYNAKPTNSGQPSTRTLRFE